MSKGQSWALNSWRPTPEPTKLFLFPRACIPLEGLALPLSPCVIKPSISRALTESKPL